jgi:hypothetical protein
MMYRRPSFLSIIAPMPTYLQMRACEKSYADRRREGTEYLLRPRRFQRSAFDVDAEPRRSSCRDQPTQSVPEPPKVQSDVVNFTSGGLPTRRACTCTPSRFQLAREKDPPSGDGRLRTWRRELANPMSLHVSTTILVGSGHYFEGELEQARWPFTSCRYL